MILEQLLKRKKDYENKGLTKKNFEYRFILHLIKEENKKGK